jgi:hypothetical protein
MIQGENGLWPLAFAVCCFPFAVFHWRLSFAIYRFPFAVSKDLMNPGSKWKMKNGK